MRHSFQTISDIILSRVSLENDETKKLRNRIHKRKDKKTISQSLVYQIASWKSNRSKHWILKNTKRHIDVTYKYAMKTNDDVLKLHILTAIKGVNIPTASAILMFIEPESYPVIDTRVWQLLYDFGEVDHNENGIALTLEDWRTYLSIIRRYAKQNRKGCREIENILFGYMQEHFKIKRD